MSEKNQNFRFHVFEENTWYRYTLKFKFFASKFLSLEIRNPALFEPFELQNTTIGT